MVAGRQVTSSTKLLSFHFVRKRLKRQLRTVAMAFGGKECTRKKILPVTFNYLMAMI